MQKMDLVAITGNTYPVRDQLKSMGARWNPDAKAWMIDPGKAEQAKAIVAGAPGSRYNPIYRSHYY